MANANNKIDLTPYEGLSINDLKELVFGVYNANEILLNTDFELGKVTEQLNPSQISQVTFREGIKDGKNARNLYIAFQIPALDNKCAIEPVLVLNERDNNFSTYFSLNPKYFSDNPESRLTNSETKELFELMKPSEKIKIEDIELKITRIIDVIASNHEINGGMVKGWNTCDVLDFAEIDKTFKNTFLADSIIRKLESLESNYGTNNAIFIISSALNETVIPDTAKGYEIFLDSVKESEKELVEKQATEKQNAPRKKSLKI